MLARIRYVSEFTNPLSRDQLRELVRVAAERNAEKGITGILMASGGLFFQIIEGPPQALETLFEKILQDPRHKNVMLLRKELPIDERFFPDWAMHPIAFTEEQEERLEPLKVIMETIFDHYHIINKLTFTLEQGIWREFLE